MKKHVLFLCSWYPNRYNATLGNFVANHASCAAKVAKVSTLFVCAGKEDFGEVYHTETSQTKEGILNVAVYYRDSGFLPLKLYRYLKAHWVGRHIIAGRRGGISLVHLHVINPAGTVALLWSWLLGIRFIITEHSTAYLPGNAKSLGLFAKLLAKACLRNAELLTVVSKNLGTNLAKLAKPKRLEILNNVVDETIFYPNFSKAASATFRFIHISTLVPDHKNPAGILRAFAQFAAKQSNIELLIISDGEIEPIKQLAAELGVEELVKFRTTQPMEEIANELRASNCLVLFSNYENMPVVISEAWMCGLPVITTDVGGIAEHLNVDNGILIDKEDEMALNKAFETVIVFPDRFNSIAISEYAKGQFSSAAIAKKLEGLYA